MGWRPRDERLPVSWLQWDEPSLHDLKREALARDADVEVVVGAAPDMERPWANADRCWVAEDDRGYWLIADDGFALDDDDVQRARIVERDC